MKPGKDAAKKPHLGKGQSWETFDRQMGPWLSTNGGAGVGMAWRGDEAFGALPERLPVAEDGENLVLELAGRADWIAQVPRFTATTQADRVTANKHMLAIRYSNTQLLFLLRHQIAHTQGHPMAESSGSIGQAATHLQSSLLSNRTAACTADPSGPIS